MNESKKEVKRISCEESQSAKQNEKTYRIKNFTVVHPELCKTADEVDRIVSEKLDENTTTLSLQEQFDLWNEVQLLALEGEKDATIEELAPYFESNPWGQDENGRYVLKSTLVQYMFLYFKNKHSGYDYTKMCNYGYDFDESCCEKTSDRFCNLWNERDKKRKTYEESKCKEPRPEDKDEVYNEFSVNGDIIITDPCYIDDWVRPQHSRGTIYGDWSCSVFKCNGDKKEKIGEFCADGGKVCVTELPPKFSANRKEIDKWVKEHNWCATVLEKFAGTVKYVIKTRYYAYHGVWNSDKSLEIQGSGKLRGKKIEFVAFQTGL